MEDLSERVTEFIRVRQLNIAVAALLTLVYLVYQYRVVLFKLGGVRESQRCRSRSRSRSNLSKPRSRSRSRSRQSHEYKPAETKHRRGRKPTRRCTDCSLCNNYDS